MPYKIAIASGKGGTGKTSVSISLFLQMQETFPFHIELVDCDVEEPNDLLFFQEAKKTATKQITQQIPVIDHKLCTYCNKCDDSCEFNAIVIIPKAKYADINTALCHSCGACSYFCPTNAISENAHPIGNVNFYQIDNNHRITEGKLKIGSAMQTMLIKELKKNLSANSELAIFDAPPGTSCSTVETINDANYVVLVTEPTPFGLHDLKLMVKLVNDLKLPFGVIINKNGIGNTALFDYLQSNNIEILGEIPFSKDFANQYAEGNISLASNSDLSQAYQTIIQSLKSKIFEHEGNYYS